MRFVACLLLCLSAASTARAADLTADQILEKSRRSGAMGLVGAKAEVKLLVDDGKGDVKERKLTASAVQLPDEVRHLVRFQDPADVRGVAFLSIEKTGQPSERLLYLPSQKRVRRVSGRAGGQSFQSTDFAYADLDLAGGKDDKSTREADAKVDTSNCWVVSTVPADSPYSKVVSFVHQDTGVPLQVLYYDKDGSTLVKRLKATRVKQVDGKWYAFESVMETIAKHSKTTLTILNLDTKSALPADDFTEQALERP